MSRERAILYACGYFLTDYEGISGYEEYRDDLLIMYFPTLDRTDGRLLRLEMMPMQICRFRLNRASEADALWLGEVLDRESGALGARVHLREDGRLEPEAA